MTFLRSRILSFASAVAAAVAAGTVGYAQTYPNHPVTIVVPFAPGGTTDILARMFGQKLEQRLGKTFLVENRPGAGTLIAASAVARAEPDGHTLLMGTSSTMAVNVTLYKKLPYDPLSDFVPRRPRTRPVRIGRQSVPSCHLAAGVDQIRQGEAGPALVCVSRTGSSASSLRRAPDEHRRHRDELCPVQGHCAGPQ